MANEQFFYKRPLFPAQLNMAHPLTRGLVGCWVLNENSPTSMRAWDSSPYGNHGLVSGALGRHPGRSFNGIDDLISIPDHASLDTTGSFSVGIWFKLDSVATDLCLMSKETGTRQQIQILFIAASKYLYSELYDGTNAPVGLSAVNSIDTVGKWYQAWLVVNKTVDIRFIIDGQPSGSPVTDTTGSIINTQVLQIGKRTVGAGIFLDGQVGEVIFYNRALTPAEIQHNYLKPWDMFLR